MKRYRQGDVLITETTEIPDGLKPVPKDHGCVILAYGEVTGHAHRVQGEAELFFAGDITELEERFMRIENETCRDIDVWKCIRGREITWIPATVGTARIESADFAICGRETVSGLAVTHEEHLPFIVPPGHYRVSRQREYAPEELRTVAD